MCDLWGRFFLFKLRGDSFNEHPCSTFKVAFCILGSTSEESGGLRWCVILEVYHRLLEFGKQQRVFVTAHRFLGRSLLFPQSALDLFGCRLGAAAGGVEDAGL